MRAIWKGHIRFSLVTIPIRIYNAIETSNNISFRQLSKEDHSPIGYQKISKKSGKPVKNEDIVKGYQYEPDQYVIVEEEDFEKVKLKSTKIIEIEGFVKASEVHPTLYDTPYYAGPDGDVAAKAYALLRETLKETGKLGIGRVVLRDRESIMLMAPKDNGLLLYKLRYPDEVRSIQQVPQLDGMEADKDQLKLAHTLVDSMTTKLEDIELKDRYHEALKDMIMAKVEGKEIISVTEEERPVVDIMTALKQSIDQAKSGKKPMEKAKGKKKEKEEKEKTSSGTKKRKQA